MKIIHGPLTTYVNKGQLSRLYWRFSIWRSPSFVLDYENWACWPWLEVPVPLHHPFIPDIISPFPPFPAFIFPLDTHCLMIEGHTHTLVFRWQYVVYFLYFKGLLFTNKITKKKNQKDFLTNTVCLHIVVRKFTFIFLSSVSSNQLIVLFV